MKFEKKKKKTYLVETNRIEHETEVHAGNRHIGNN